MGLWRVGGGWGQVGGVGGLTQGRVGAGRHLEVEGGARCQAAAVSGAELLRGPRCYGGRAAAAVGAASGTGLSKRGQGVERVGTGWAWGRAGDLWGTKLSTPSLKI